MVALTPDRIEFFHSFLGDAGKVVSMGMIQRFGQKNRTGARRRVRDDFLLPAQHFDAALRRERLRSDRTLSQFAMLTLDFGKRRLSDQLANVVNAVLQHRVRESDTAGWLDERKAGVILPETSPAGAWKLAGDLDSALADRGLRAQCDVYVYPTLNAGNGRSPDVAEGPDENKPADSLTDQPLETLLIEKLPTAKRLVDVVHATLGLLMASPVMFAAALAVKLTSRGPIFMRSSATVWAVAGFGFINSARWWSTLTTIKAQLRSMSEQDGPAFKIRNDPRRHGHRPLVAAHVH